MMESFLPIDFEGKRLDDALAKAGIYPSRSIALKAIKEGLVLVNGKSESSHYKLKSTDRVEYSPYVKPESKLKKEDIPLKIAYEDEDVLVIDKPQGMVVHPGNGHHEGTLANALLGYADSLANKDSVRPGLVHRIDKDTSGLVMIAKNEEAFAFLSEQLKDHSMHREYLALVKGIILEEEGKIDAPIARDPDSPLKYKVDVRKGKESVTYFRVKERYRNAQVSLIDCRLLTGRTHQIRVHMEYIGHPVIGDPLYGSGNRKIYDRGQLLHAHKLTFVHPKTKKEVTVTSELPEYFENVLKGLD